MNVEFIKNPTGMFGLAYGPGDVVEFDHAFAKKLIELGYAIEAKGFVFPDDLASGPETAESKFIAEKAIRKSGKKG